MLHNFYITSAMVISNVMARSLVRLKQDVPAEISEAVFNQIAEEGRDSCSLEDDEIHTLYDKTRVYMGRIFRNPRLHPAIDEFARTLSRRRSMSGNEILDELRALSLI